MYLLQINFPIADIPVSHQTSVLMWVVLDNIVPSKLANIETDIES